MRNSPRILARAIVTPASMRRSRRSNKEKEIFIAKNRSRVDDEQEEMLRSRLAYLETFYRESSMSSGRSCPRGAELSEKAVWSEKISMPKIILQDVPSVCLPGQSVRG